MNVRKRVYPIVVIMAVISMMISIIFFIFIFRDSSEKNRKELDHRNKDLFETLSIEMLNINIYDKRDSLTHSAEFLIHLLNEQQELSTRTVFDVFDNYWISLYKGVYDSDFYFLPGTGTVFIYYDKTLHTYDDVDVFFGLDSSEKNLLSQISEYIINKPYPYGDQYDKSSLDKLFYEQPSCFELSYAVPEHFIYWDSFSINNIGEYFIMGYYESNNQVKKYDDNINTILNSSNEALIRNEDAFFTKSIVTLVISMAILFTAIIILSYLVSRKVSTPIEEKIEKSESENKMLTEMDRVKTRALSEVAHELKTPLSVISAYSEAVLDQIRQLPDCENSDHMLELIKNESNHMALTVSQVLDLTRIEENRLTLERRNCHLDSVITNAAEMYFPMLNNRGNRLRLKVPCDLPAVFIDSSRITRVIINLLTNAIKATENNLITISAEDDVDYIRVNVADKGCGIPEEALPHIFDRYYKLNQSGTGLGLYIVKTIIEAHGGTIEVKSVVGEGTTFSFTLPVSGSAEDSQLDL